MKKIIAQIFFLILISIAFTSCEGLLNNCKVCSLNTYEDGALILSQSEAEYCDAKLISIQATPAQTDGNLVIKWECK